MCLFEKIAQTSAPLKYNSNHIMQIQKNFQCEMKPAFEITDYHTPNTPR
jgi:hypothetical protein